MLPTERYKMFSKALVEYKKTGDFQKLTPVLVGIFTEDCQCYHLFRSKYQYSDQMNFFRVLQHENKLLLITGEITAVIV